MNITEIIEQATALKTGNGPATSWARERKLADLVIDLAEQVRHLKATVDVLVKMQ